MAKKAIWVLPLLVLMAGGLLSLTGCFQTPTNPHVDAFTTGGGNGGSGGGPGGGTGGGGGHLTPTPTPITGGGHGTIHGTVTGSSGETVTISAAGTSGSFTTTRSGDGAYTISNVTDGSYYISAVSTSHYGFLLTAVVISGGNTVSNVDITMF